MNNYIKNFFKKLYIFIVNNKSLLLRLLFVVVISTALLLTRQEFSISKNPVYMHCVFMFLLAFVAPGYLFGFISFITMLLLVLNLHLVRVYGYPFKISYYMIIDNAIDNMALSEYYGYLSLISKLEYLLFFVGIIIFVLFAFTKRIKQKPYILNILCIISVSLIITRGYTRHFIQVCSNRAIEEIKEIKSVQNDIQNFAWNSIGNESTMPKNVILIIGESHRYDYFTKYWNQKPKLNNLLYFNNMISQDFYTAPVVGNILSRKRFSENRTGKYLNEFSLFKLFEEAGYKTYSIRYQYLNDKAESSMDFIFADAQKFYLYSDKHFIDDRNIKKIINDILLSNDRKFIVAEMIGLHIPLARRYPKDYDIIKPSLTSVGKKMSMDIKNKEYIINSYENGINFSVDIIYDFFKIAEGEKESTLIMFVSDHGLELFDNGSFGYANSEYNYHVPFMIYGNNEFMKNVDSDKWNNLKNHIDSKLIENDIFETIVSLSSIEYNDTNKSRERNRDLTKITNKLIDKRPVNTINDVIIYDDVYGNI